MNHNEQIIKEAVIYARVSSTKQVTQGDGLNSQDTRCREYAKYKGYAVIETFSDDMSGSLITRPGMQAMLKFLRKRKKTGTVVIIDDISRLARGIEAHLQLRSALNDAGGKLESPSIEFGEDSDSILVENLLASVSQHQRQKTGEQTINRMRARSLGGYWVFQAPIGYQYVRKAGHGKVLVRHEPYATMLQEAFEGFATGRFETQVEVKRFLESCPEFPKDTKSGEIRNQRITDWLTRPIYAGYIEVPNWNVSLRKGQHEALISFETFQKIQDRLTAGAKAPARKNISEDFPLRGFVLCHDCSKPLTACWSKSKTGKKHPYYLCPTKGCTSYRKSIRRDVLEGEFIDLLHTLQPTESLFDLAKTMFKDIWTQRQAQADVWLARQKRYADKIDKQIEGILDRIVDSDNPAVVTAYEARITKLEKERLVIAEKLQNGARPTHTFEDLFELAFKFLQNPWKIWASGQLTLQKMVLRLAFCEQISYCRNQGLRTPNLSLPFKALESFQMGESRMVTPRGFEPLTYRLGICRSILLSYGAFKGASIATTLTIIRIVKARSQRLHF